jgi:hypothetical protein
MDKKLKPRLIPAVISGIVLVLIIVLIVIGAVQNKKEDKSNEASVSVDRINLKDDGSTAAQLDSLKTEVEIQFDDSAVPVGTTLKLVALVVPENTEQALVWNVSDTSVAVIDEDGILTVTGTGTTVITATVGTVTDSVVIEGIENVASGSKNNLPVYTGTTVAQGGNAAGGTGNTQTTGGTVSTDSETVGKTDNEGGSSENAACGSSGDTGTGESSGTVSGGGSGETTGGNTQTTGNSGQTTGSLEGSTQTTGNGGSSAGGTSVSAGQLSDYGFTQRYSNVYVYEADQTYYGEIITQPNVTIIYIKQRNSEFDAKIQAVIRELIPEDNGQVWSNYLSAGTDRTFMVDDHKVRIVVAPNGGHSQIVIYN